MRYLVFLLGPIPGKGFHLSLFGSGQSPLLGRGLPLTVGCNEFNRYFLAGITQGTNLRLILVKTLTTKAIQAAFRGCDYKSLHFALRNNARSIPTLSAYPRQLMMLPSGQRLELPLNSPSKTDWTNTLDSTWLLTFSDIFDPKLIHR